MTVRFTANLLLSFWLEQQSNGPMVLEPCVSHGAIWERTAACFRRQSRFAAYLAIMGRNEICSMHRPPYGGAAVTTGGELLTNRSRKPLAHCAFHVA